MPRTSSTTTQVFKRTANDRPETLSADAVVDYIHDLSGQLGMMAGQAHLPRLQHLLTLVQIEARSVIASQPPAPRPRSRTKVD